MADIIVSKELANTAEEYRSLATTLQTEIDDFDANVVQMSSTAIFGEAAPEDIVRLWTGTGSEDGVKGAMQSYVTKLNEAATNIDNYLATLQVADTRKGEEAADLVHVVS